MKKIPLLPVTAVIEFTIFQLSKFLSAMFHRVVVYLDISEILRDIYHLQCGPMD